jgi:glycosyltransferase involved in cell wall biosynthesis
MEKKILLFIDSLGGGGAQRQLVNLALLLKQEGLNVSVATYFDKPFYSNLLSTNNIHYEIIQNARRSFTRIYYVYKYIKKNDFRYVIAYQDTPSLIACITKLLGCHIHLVVSERNTTQIINFKTRLKFNLYRVANYVVPNSYTQNTFIIKYFNYLEPKLRLITNFIDTEHFHPVERTERGLLKIICVARLYPQKNAIRFVEAVKVAKSRGVKFRVDWYGFKAKDYQLAQKKIERFHLSDYIQFHDPTPNVFEKYCDADVFCLPSLYEGFPNVLCEAMSCGLPVLFSNVCDNPLIAKDGINGYSFNPTNVEEMADAIVKMVSLSYEERIEMGRQSRFLIEKNFSKQKFIDKYKHLLEN